LFSRQARKLQLVIDLCVTGTRRDGYLAQQDSYERARTFLETTWELFDSWSGDEIVASKAVGTFLASHGSGSTGDGRVTAGRFDHRDSFFDVRGQFNVPRSPRGRPVIFQTGDSAEGREFAASSADAISAGMQPGLRSRSPRPPAPGP